MDHRPDVRERDVDGVHARPRGRIELTDPRERFFPARGREDAHGQVRGAHRRRHRRRTRLARQIRQRARLGHRQRQRLAGARDLPRDHERAEGGGAEQHDLPLGEDAGEPPAEVLVGRRGQRRDHDVGVAHGLAEIRRRLVQARGPLALIRRQRDALRERAEILRAPAPEPHAVAGQRQVGRGREGAMTAAEDSDIHRLASIFAASPRLRLRLLKRAAARTAMITQ